MADQPKLVTDSVFWAAVRLIRPWNVLMIVVAMWLILESLLTPVLAGPDSVLVFALGTVAMAALAAGANVINDYFDVAEDRFNRPDRALVGRVITRRQTMALNYLLTAIAIAATLTVCLLSKSWWPFVWNTLLGTLLWGYSPWFKRRFLRGNVVIAFSVGQLPLWCLLLVATDGAWKNWLGTLDGYVLLGYVVLSTYVTFLREMTKDWQDAHGDGLAGYDTLPVRWGARRTQSLLHILHGIGWGLMLAAWWASWHALNRPTTPLFFILPYAGVHTQLMRGRIESVSAWQKLTLAGGLVFLAGLMCEPLSFLMG